MNGPAKARTLVCIADDDLFELVRDTLDNCGFYEVVGRARHGAALAEELCDEYPDVVIIDEALSQGSPELFLARATAGRPVPALLLTEIESGEAVASDSTIQISRLGKDVLRRSDGLATNHVWTRLLAVAKTATAAKYTQTATKLQAMIQREVARAQRDDIRPEVIALTTWSLDLILVVGGQGSHMTLEKLARAWSSVGKVPVVIAVSEAHRLDLPALTSPEVPVRRLEYSTELRKAEGMLVAPPEGQVVVSPTHILYEDDLAPLDVSSTLASAACLRDRVLTILISGDADLAMALGTIANADGLVATLDPADSAGPAGPAAAVSWEIADAVLHPRELAWIVAHAVSRRA